MVCQRGQQHPVVGICEGVLLPYYCTCDICTMWTLVLPCYPINSDVIGCKNECTCCCIQLLTVPLQAWWRALITRLFCCCSKMVSPQCIV